MGLSFILGGAIGNLIDRIAFRKVVDFLDCDIPDIVIPHFEIGFFSFPGYYLPRWPIFNVADMAVTVGILLIFMSLYIYGDSFAAAAENPEEASHAE